jgi:hypothetical protein
MDFTLAVKSQQGQVLTTPETIGPRQKLAIDLTSLITQLGGDPTGAFAQGSASIYFVGTIMPIVGQITATNPQLSLVHESVMVEHDPGRSDIPAVLNGLWWGLGAGRATTVMVSNTSANPQTAQVYLDVQGQRQTLSTPLSFVPYETKVLDITQLLTTLGVDPAQAPTGGITIVQSGATPSLIAAGRITDPTSGFSSTIHFPSPDLEVTSALHATGVPVGTPSNDSPFVGAGTFTPHVVVRNLSATAQTVTVTLEYPQPPSGTGPAPAPLDPVAAQDGRHSPATVQSLVTTTTVPPYTTQDISLAAMSSAFPAALPFASVRIQYSGAPGSLEAEVPSVESAGNMVVDSIVQNEGNGWAGSGANPWHLDQDTESILFLTNASDQPAHIGFQVTADGSAPYHLNKLLLNAHETRAIDIRKLRDAQQPDFRKNLIPSGATDGSVIWVRGDNLPVVGRLMQIHRKQGMASNYDCGTCPCPYSYTPSLNYIYPTSLDVAINQLNTFSFYAGYEDCNGVAYWYNYSDSASWSSGNYTIALAEYYGTLKGVGAGTTSFSASYTDYAYVSNGSHCIETPLPGGASGTVGVGDGTPGITSISPNPWVSGNTYTNGTIGGVYFGTNPTVSLSDSTISPYFTYTPVSDTQIDYTVTIPSTTPTESVTVTVTSNGYNGSGFIAIPGNPGQSSKGTGSVTNNAPYINRFWESSWGTQGVSTLEFTYHWTSNTGNLLDLAKCTIDEYVTSSLGTGTLNWPPPWNYQVTYPIPSKATPGEGWLPTDGFDSDYDLAGTFSKPYVAAQFTDTQIFHFSCPGYNGGNWVQLAGPYSIVRSVSQTNGTWQYTVTKNDGKLTYNLP